MIMTNAPDVWIPAAGVPKFVTLFGRDSLIVSLQNMITHAGFAVGTLKKLGQLQATELDDWRDAQPGKILHEIRTGELARLGQIPHSATRNLSKPTLSQALLTVKQALVFFSRFLP